MPVSLQKYLNPTTEMAVWKITETVADLQQHLWMFAHEEFKFESRNLHWLASRMLLQELLKDKTGRQMQTLAKTDTGKPYITGLDYNISISHSGVYAAALISKTQQVGIDIEEITPRIKKIAHKFINEREWSFLEGDGDLHTMYLLWAAKEAIFKWYGKGAVDFKHHMNILLPLKPGLETLQAELKKDAGYQLNLHTQLIDEQYRLCWVAG